MDTLTNTLGRFVAELNFEAIPAVALNTIHFGMADCVGTVIAGRVEPVSEILLEVLNPEVGPANLLFYDKVSRSTEAALINGAAAHALDYDDVGLRGHPSTVLVPAILALAQELNSSGKDVMTAYAAGFEVWADLANRDPDQHHNKGWHPTGIFGAVGAAAACAKLLGLSAHESAMAIALGASHSAGVMANFGTMTKPYHAGNSARAGVMAAKLVKSGFTASTDALEHSQGFLMAVSPNGKADVSRESNVGQSWGLIEYGLSIKKYPLCFCTHRAIDGMLDILAKRPILADEIESIKVTTSLRNTRVLRNSRPKTGLEAKFSMEFAMACAVVANRVGLTELTDEFVLQPNVQHLIERVLVVADEVEDPHKPGYAKFDFVEVKLKSGDMVDSGPITQVRGDAVNPLTPEALWIKFEDCARAGGLTQCQPRQLFDALMSLEHLGSVSDIPGLSRRS